MGGTVTTYDAGMAVPNWPTTYSFWFYPIHLWLAVWDVFLEHGHRLLAQLAGILAVLLAATLWRGDDRRWMRWVGVAIVVGVIAQGTLGGIRVWANDRLLARIHGCMAPLYFGLSAAAVAWTSRQWRRPLSCVKGGVEGDGSVFAETKIGTVPLPRLAWFVTAAIYLEIVLGALLRRPSADLGVGGGTELWGWLQTLLFGQVATWFELCVLLKVLNAGLIALGSVWLVVGVLRRSRIWGANSAAACEGQMLARRAWWFAAIVSVQLLLAAITWVANYGWPAWFARGIWPLQSAVLAQGRLLVLVTTAHAAIGSLTLAAALNLTLWLNRGDCPNFRVSENGTVPLDAALPAREGTLPVIDYWHLVRPRIVALVLLSMAVSAWMTADVQPRWVEVASALIGTALVIVGAIALNQRLECAGDAKMPRTADRPLPAGRLSRRQVTTFGLAATFLGLAYLAMATDLMLTGLAAIGWLIYVGIYTPLKHRSPWQTPVGAAAGAMPVLLGAAVGGGSLSPWAMVLFGIVFCWQFPHSMAIAWRYRSEFAAAGVKVAAVTDPTGRTAGVLAILGAAALLPVSLIPLQLGLAGMAYGVVVFLLGAAYLMASIQFARCRDDKTSRRLLIASFIYLPAMMAVFLGLAFAP